VALDDGSDEFNVLAARQKPAGVDPNASPAQIAPVQVKIAIGADTGRYVGTAISAA
jgi:hypothetical protein